jgi:hypothetical protein
MTTTEVSRDSADAHGRTPATARVIHGAELLGVRQPDGTLRLTAAVPGMGWLAFELEREDAAFLAAWLVTAARRR